MADAFPCPTCKSPLSSAGELPGSRVSCSRCGGATLVPSPGASPGGPGQRVATFARFKLIAEVGRGGMGVVYRAWDERLERVVALKTIRQDSSIDDDAIARFYREARGLARLKHPCIVAIHDVGEHEGVHFLAMDFIEGTTLERRLASKSATPLPLEKAVAIVRDVARAIHYAHQEGVLHRDVKPQNVMLDGQDRPYVMGFGLARLDGGSGKLTETGTALGTPAFMSPEQAAGRGVDARSDVWSLGATLYRVVAGRPPFQGETAYNVIAALLSKEAEPASSSNPSAKGALDAICRRCLEKDPARRYESAEALALDLDRYLGGKPVSAGPRPGRARARGSRRRLPVALIAGGALLVVGLALVVHSLGQRAATEPGAVGPSSASRKEDDAARRAREARRQLDQALSSKHSQDLRGAVAAATRAIERDARSAAAWECRGEARIGLGDAEAGIADLGRAIELDPRSERPLRVRGEARLVRGELDLAIADLTRALELDPGKSDAFAARGAARIAKGELARAIEDLDRAASIDPRSRAAFVLRAEAHEKQDELDLAALDLTRAIELDEKKADAWAIRARVQLAKGALGAARKDAERAVELDPRLAEGFLVRGSVRLDQNDFEGAISDERKAIELEPRRALAHALLARARFLSWKADLALEDVSRALELDPRCTEAWLVRAGVHYSRSELAAAEADATRAIELDAKSQRAFMLRGLARYAGGRFDDSIADFGTVLARDPRHVDALCYSAAVRLAKGDEDGSIADATRALEVVPACAAALAVRGMARAKNGERDGAVRDLERYLEVDSSGIYAKTARSLLEKLKKK
ncbi:protein kinase [bacterium]|nr:protein kinase [bacterium]